MVTDIFNIEHSLLKSRVWRLNKYFEELEEFKDKDKLNKNEIREEIK